MKRSILVSEIPQMIDTDGDVDRWEEFEEVSSMIEPAPWVSQAQTRVSSSDIGCHVRQVAR